MNGETVTFEALFRVLDSCVICDYQLTKQFPKDYPDEWKFCCICKNLADDMAHGVVLADVWKKEIIDRIRKRITLVENAEIVE